MKSVTLALAASLMLAGISIAEARDDRLRFPIKDAMATPAAQEKLDGSVRFYFSGQKQPGAKKTMGTFTSNKKTNFANKSDVDGCNHAFLSAMIALQERARREGGNAVVDIHSVYKNGEYKSATEFECGAGAIMGGVALRGTVATLP